MTKRDPQKVKRKKERDEKVCNLYVLGITVSDIIEKTKVPETTIFNILKKHKVQLRGGRSISKAREDKVIALYNDTNNTIKTIMDNTGIKSEQTIYRILRERNVILRKKTNE